MLHRRKSSIGVILIASTIVLTGCTFTTNDRTDPKVLGVSSENPCPKVSTNNTFGDVVPLKEITDTYGTYCHVTLNKKSIPKPQQLSTNIINTTTFDKAGFTTENINTATQNTLKHIAEVTLDSIVFDVAYEKENLTVTPKFEYFISREALIDVKKKVFTDETTKINGVALVGVIPITERNGLPRADQTQLSIGKIVMKETLDNETKTPILNIPVNVICRYTVSDFDLINFFVMKGVLPPNNLVAANDLSAELVDGENNVIFLNGRFIHSYKTGEFNKIVDADIENFNVVTSTGLILTQQN